MYLKPDVIAKLRTLAKGGQYGEVVERAVADPVSYRRIRAK